MDKRRFGIILLLVAVGLAVIAWRMSKQTPPADDTATTQPAGQADQPETAAETNDTGEAPATPPAETEAAATADAQSTDQPADAAPPAETQDAPAAQPAIRATRTRYGAYRQPPQKPVLGSLSPEDGYEFRVEFENSRAGVNRVELVDYFETVADKQLWDEVNHDQAEYAKRAAEKPNVYKGHYSVVKPVSFGGIDHFALGTPAIDIYRGKDATPVSIEEIMRGTWRLVDQTHDETSQSLTFSLTLYEDLNWDQPDQAPNRRKFITLRKTYTVTKGSYSIGMSLQLVNHTDENVRITVNQVGPTGTPQEAYRGDERQLVIAKLDDGQIMANKDADLKKLTQMPFSKPEAVGESNAPSEPVVWVGLVNKYFGMIVYPKPKMKGQLNAVSAAATYYIQAVQASAMGAKAPAGGTGRMWLAGAWLKELSLKPAGKDGDALQLDFDVFAGPKKRELFRENALYAQLKYSETITARSCVCPESLISWLRRGLLWLLGVFSSFLFGNYGLAIMLLVALVRVCLHPLTKKGQVMMAGTQKKMAAMKPQMDRVREKFANDKAAQQREMMKLYKEHGTGMGGMLGCLPMLLQMPIWIALFSGLNTSVELRHAAFLPVWITDLSVPDRLFSFGTSLPLIGESFNLLPLLLAASMYFQSKLNPSMSGSTASMSPEQEQQQKMMRVMMPVMMLIFFYQMPSGLNLYIMASTTVGVVEQYYIRKHIREKDELEAAGETTVKVSGKGPRSSRPKKPKGPFWTKRG